MLLYTLIAEISGFSTHDYVQLVGHYSKLKHGPTIDPRLLDRFANDPKRLEQIKEQVKSKPGRQHKSLNVVFKAPIEEFNFEYFSYVYTLYTQYQKGVNPFTGALADQPAQIIEIFNTLAALEAEDQEKQRKETEAKAKRNKK